MVLYTEVRHFEPPEGRFRALEPIEIKQLALTAPFGV